MFNTNKVLSSFLSNGVAYINGSSNNTVVIVKGKCDRTSIKPPIPLPLAVNIYPNPTHNRITIDYQNHVHELQSINLYNMMGQLITPIELNATGSTSVDITSLAGGVYIVLFTDKIGRTIGRKIRKLN